MKNYVLLLFISLAVLSSCSMRKDNVDTPHPGDKKSLLTKHTWKCVDAVQYVNGHRNGKIHINNLSYSFDKNNHFFIKENGQVIKQGQWDLLNFFDQAVLRLIYIKNDQNQTIEDFEISILTEDYLQLDKYFTDTSNNTILTEYFFSK